MKAALAIAAVLFPLAAFGQSPPAPPGPYVIDLRGTMSGVPSASAFHAGLPAGALVPKRGFGIGGGGHVYLFTLGPSRIGVGVDASRERGTSSTPAGATGTPATTTSTAPPADLPATPVLSPASAISVATTITVISPQVSFNFGTHDGWSYLSGGFGTAHIQSEASGEPAAPFSGAATFIRDEGRTTAINYGGGARWFLREHLAVGFDLRFHRIAAHGTQPLTRTFVMSAGVSVR